MKKYLYVQADQYDNYVRRYEITRETKTLYIIKTNNGKESRINKNKMYVRHGSFSFTHYSIETKELIEKYGWGVLHRRFIRRLKELEKCEDIDIIKKVLSIVIPDEDSKANQEGRGMKEVDNEIQEALKTVQEQTEEKMCNILYGYREATGQEPPKFNTDKESIEQAFSKMTEVIRVNEEYKEYFWNKFLEKYSIDFITQIAILPESIMKDCPAIPRRLTHCIRFSEHTPSNQILVCTIPAVNTFTPEGAYNTAIDFLKGNGRWE